MVQVFVFDSRRGAREGTELDKVLAFWPPSTSTDAQQARRRAAGRDWPALTRRQGAVGLVEALCGMTRIFSGPAAPLCGLTTALRRHVLLEPEPDVWFSLVRPRGVGGGWAR
jgi:hypothetical protein